MMDQLLADLRKDEGFNHFVYEDTRGYDTIGYGFLIDPQISGGLPRPVAEFWLRYAVNERLDELRKRWPAFDSQPEDVQRALGSMAYQMGVSGLLNFRDMFAALERGDRVAAASEALQSVWARQTPKRAQRVAGLIRGT